MQALLKNSHKKICQTKIPEKIIIDFNDIQKLQHGLLFIQIF